MSVPSRLYNALLAGLQLLVHAVRTTWAPFIHDVSDEEQSLGGRRISCCLSLAGNCPKAQIVPARDLIENTSVPNLALKHCSDHSGQPRNVLDLLQMLIARVNPFQHHVRLRYLYEIQEGHPVVSNF